MLKNVSKKSALLVGAAMALSALAMASMALAASWSPIGTSDGIIDSGNFGFSIPAANSGASCGNTTFNVTVDSAAVATITNATFRNCVGDVGAANGCTATAVGNGFPWRATALSTNNIQWHDMDVTVRFVTKPPAGSVACANNGVDLTLTRTMSFITWTPPFLGFHFFESSLAAHIIGVVGGLTTSMRGSGTATGLLKVLD